MHAMCCMYQDFNFGNESSKMGCSDNELATAVSLLLL